METPHGDEKLGRENDAVYASSSTDDVEQHQKNYWVYLKHYFTSREGWIGDYVRPLVLIPNYQRGILTKAGLHVPHNPQYLAPQPQVQKL